ncbi:MAG: response regulator transcription factor [Anaerolineaceae bacterium]|nr:response regulator transcription factor [Anaerolineaceae bacterium]MCB9101284.1 response regulator transcription factor [Anaerolineales bacterium]
MKQKTILFVDNTASFLDVHARLLEEAGYRVYRAYSMEQAEEKLATQHVHMMILDIRLEEEDDGQDISGLLLAQREIYRPIPKIILTAYPSFELAREALGPRIDSLPPAVNFIGKYEGFDAIRQAVEQVFNEHVRLNWQLDIRRDNNPGLSLAHLVTLIEPDLDHRLLPARIEELEDLLCCLFHHSQQINLHRLIAAGENKVTLAVYSFLPEGLPFRLLVTCGLRQAIRQEDECFEKFAPRAATEGATAKLMKQRYETTRYAALAYILTDADLENITPFSEFYRYHQPKAIRAVLGHLFGHTLDRYHQQNVKIEETASAVASLAPYFFEDDDRFTLAALLTQINRLQKHAVVNNLPHLDETALALLTSLLKGDLPVEGSIYHGITHKRLSGETILVDNRDRSWLIEFGGLSQGPLIQDFIHLEVVIKFTLLGDLPYEDRRQLEEYLQVEARAETGAGYYDHLSDEIHQALTIIHYIRRYALQKFHCTPPLYQMGLLLSTLKVINTYDDGIYYRSGDMARFMHALDSIREICLSFSPDPPVYDKSHSPWLDEQRLGYDVWLEGQWLTLAETEYKLLAVLYRHAVDQTSDSLCTFAMIGKGVWGDYDRLRDYNNIQSLVRRVRDKLQPQGDNSYQYIENVRGVGYRLILNSHAPAE